jgi:catechol 2,3-dioxygenase-like lactoylglutathione lyase family enzyme
MLRRLDHVNLVVEDLAAMTAFYRDVLGLRLSKEVAISGDWIEAVTKLEDVEADVAYLEGDAGAGLELIRYRTPEGSRPAALERPNSKGIRHIAFRVDDLDPLVSALKAKGVRLLSGIQRVPTEQVDFGGVQKRIVYCLDPEGNLVELCAFQ